ncbi:MAG: hypothetical protein V2I35_11795 [Desulfocapsaceae bacterium]|nr:hypothetical protein [Desulfocapsaceae bacterium]
MQRKSKKFKFKGYDNHGEPIVMSNDNRRITGQDEQPPELTEDDLVMKVYSVNPTWVKIGGRWYRIG